MPKERIGGEAFDVDVAWGKDACYVQVGTVIPAYQGEPGVGDASSITNLRQLIESWDRHAAQDTSDEQGRKSDADLARGLYATLDRAAVNRLVQTLRKARDQAFGADA